MPTNRKAKATQAAPSDARVREESKNHSERKLARTKGISDWILTDVVSQLPELMVSTMLPKAIQDPKCLSR